jgi:aldose 1-epimerase
MIRSYKIENQYLRIKTLNIGASLFEVFDKKKKINLILNLGSQKNYLRNKAYLGSTCGRFANRIRNASFVLNKKKYFLSQNEGSNILHGGKNSFSKKIWNLIHHKKNSIKYHHFSKHLEEGFPGNLNCFCEYSLKGREIFITMSAKTDLLTHVNLVNHAYWNLNKNKDLINNHHVLINAEQYLENNHQNIPTGKKINVEGTPFDFRKWKILGSQINLNKKGFDENFIMKSNYNARIYSPQSGILLTLYSNQPGLQFYTGQHLKFKSNKKKLFPFQGLCLETQAFPNSPNNKNFPNTVLKPNELYKHKMMIKITHQ